ncbi:glucose PTS transporter subunit IIA [Propionibacterium sp.]|uniref:glucose PTS transporter subunit IIA n=1 Tax=Propionibacterium sp. TaxID=1977903 RepID=UPI0039EBC5C0
MPADKNAPAQIIESIGGPGNIAHMTHCATRLRFELHDSSGIDQAKVEAIPGVMGAVPQAGNRYQVVIGGAVESVYNDILELPEMKGVGGAGDSAADVKAAARAQGPRGKFHILDSFFEFLSDSFRPILGALLGASLFITFMALMGTLGVIPNWADPRVQLPPTWAFINLTWQGVFYFLPLMVAYNATKKLRADPWVGFAVMGVLLLPAFSALKSSATAMTLAGQQIEVLHVFGGHLPLTIFNYGQQVFPPLLMAAVLAPVYRGLKKIIPESVQLIFVPFLTLLIMIPLTAFIIGPIGVYAGAGLSGLLKSINDFSPFIFAIVIPLLYPFMVPLGLHWPINAVMLLNIQNLGYDFIQGPMGAWNFACFGATAAVLVLSVRHKEDEMRQTALGALFAGLFGGISEPSLYGIHLRFKRIYPSMLVGCFAGGLVQGIGGGVVTHAFVFTSLLTIPAFSNIPLYALSVAVAFATAMVLVLIRDFRTAEDRADITRIREENEADINAELTGHADVDADVTATDRGTATPPVKTALQPGAVSEIVAPLAGTVMPLSQVPDPVFSKGTVGLGVGIDPTGDTVTSPGDGKVIVAQSTGHAFGIRLDNGIEVLVHVGIDTVNLEGKGFDVHVKRGDHVKAGQPLVTFDRSVIESAGYSMVTPVLVTNHRKFASVEPIVSSGEVKPGDLLLRTTAKVPATTPAPEPAA